MNEPLTREVLARIPLPGYDGGGGKEERGRVLVVAGSRDVPGAALLAGTGVLRVGAGKLQFQTTASIALHLGLAMPESMSVGHPDTQAGGIGAEAAPAIIAAAEKCSALLVGPGLVDDDETAQLVAALLAGLSGCPLVLDAAAMMKIATHRDLLGRHRGQIVVTPHSGEMAGILDRPKDAVEADPAATAREVANDLGIVVVLKGACSFIAAPGGQGFSCPHGHAGLGTSGSGDTLAGIITGLLARGAPPIEAAAWGVFLHGEAGHRLARKRGPLGYLAREIPDEVPAILADLAR